MLWFKRKKPAPPKAVELLPFSVAKLRMFTQVLCDGVAARNLPSFAELLALHARLQQEHPDVRVLASLDDLGQAGYTSGHCIQTNDLDDIEGHDASVLPAEAFFDDDGSYAGFLLGVKAFPYRHANLLRAAADIDFEQTRGLLAWETPGDGNDIITANRDPETALKIAREPEVIFQLVPVSKAAEAIAPLPNGYFSGDMDPMQNLAIARHLESAYGLALFGVGSRFLGFRREFPLTDAEARSVAADLASLYEDAPEAAADEFAGVLAGRDWLLFRYTES